MLLLFLSFLYSLFTVQNIFLEGGVRPLLWGSTSAFVHTQETLLGWGMASRRAGPHGRPKVWARYAQLHRGGGSDDWAKSGGVGDRTAGMEESNLFIGSGGTWVRGFLGDSWVYQEDLNFEEHIRKGFLRKVNSRSVLKAEEKLDKRGRKYSPCREYIR